MSGACRADCPAGTPTSCGGQCVDTNVDTNHCGKCGFKCTGGQFCAAGKCRCPSGLTFCNGLCRDTKTDRAYCGTSGCGTACKAGEVCNAGQCGLSFGGSTPTKCGASCVNLSTDGNNCGSCGTKCTGGRSCSSRTCVCPSGQIFCNGLFSRTFYNLPNKLTTFLSHLNFVR